MNLGAVGKWWTTKELGILRQVYPDGGVAACLPLLPGRTQEAIYQRAQRLQLKTSKPRGERKSWPHSPEKDERIRALYAGPRDPGDVVALARELGVPRWYVSKRATELGLVVPNQSETWSQAELDLLEATSHMLPECARRKFAKAGFKRSASAIKLRRSIDQVKASDNGYHSARQVAQLFGIDDKTVARWISMGLRARRRGTARTPEQGGDQWLVQEKDLRAFAIAHPLRIDLAKIPAASRPWFIGVLTGRPTA